VFGAQTFDIGHARNSIDHAVDPMRIIESLLDAVRVGGTIVLRHYRREAETMRYEQLHFWNFDVEDGRLLLWSKRKKYDVTKQLEDRAVVTSRIHPGSFHADWTEASIVRTAP
jgi:SAM-dependent methyltransferase